MANRLSTSDDDVAIWAIIRDVVASGGTYAYAPETTRDKAIRLWAEAPEAAFVPEVDGRVLGTYYLEPNQPGLRSHVRDADHGVAPEVGGRVPEAFRFASGGDADALVRPRLL